MKQNSFSSLAATEKYAPFKFQDTLRNYENPPIKKIKCCRIVNACSHCQTKQQPLSTRERMQQVVFARQQYKKLFRNQNRKNINKFTLHIKKEKTITESDPISLSNEEGNEFRIQNLKNDIELDNMNNHENFQVVLKECDNNQIQNRGQILIEKQNIQEIRKQEEIKNQNLSENRMNTVENCFTVEMEAQEQESFKKQQLLPRQVEQNNDKLYHSLQEQLYHQESIKQRQNNFSNYEEINIDIKKSQHEQQLIQKPYSQQQFYQINPSNQLVNEQKYQHMQSSMNQIQEKYYTQTTIKSNKQIPQNLDGKSTPNSRFRIRSGSSQCFISTRVLQKSIKHLNDVDKMIETILTQRPYLSQSTSEIKQAIKQHLKLQR